MIPDLGKYETVILSAYGATLLLIAVLILASWLSARRVQRALSRMEARRRSAAASRSAGSGTGSDSGPDRGRQASMNREA